MIRNRSSRWFFVGLYLFVASGCAYPVSRELREEADKNLTLATVLQDPTPYVGSLVIWGGEIIKTTNVGNGTEILILDSPLDSLGMPKGTEFSSGRFVARSPQFLEPALYKGGKKITIAGEITGEETRPFDKTDYAYPVVMVKQLHLWDSNQFRFSYDPYYPYPYGDWYGRQNAPYFEYLH